MFEWWDQFLYTGGILYTDEAQGWLLMFDLRERPV